MIGERIRTLREAACISQSELARRICTTRASVNAWESGLSSPTSGYIIELAKFFHVSSDYLLELNNDEQIELSGLDNEQIKILYTLLEYFHRK